MHECKWWYMMHASLSIVTNGLIVQIDYSLIFSRVLTLDLGI